MKEIHLHQGCEPLLGGRQLSPLVLNRSWYSYYHPRKVEQQRQHRGQKAIREHKKVLKVTEDELRLGKKENIINFKERKLERWYAWKEKYFMTHFFEKQMSLYKQKGANNWQWENWNKESIAYFVLRKSKT